MKPELEFLTKTIYEPEVFWAMLVAVATVILTVATVALVFVGAMPLVRAKKAELAERFREELLAPETKKLFFLASHGFLEFVRNEKNGVEGMPYFAIVHVEPPIVKERMDQIYGDQRIVMTFEMDDQLLAPLQEMAYYVERKSIRFNDAFRIFGDYVDICFSNAEILKYITWIRRKPGAAEVYKSLEELHKKMKAHNEKRRANEKK
jgi:hypothetical protein